MRVQGPPASTIGQPGVARRRGGGGLRQHFTQAAAQREVLHGDRAGAHRTLNTEVARRHPSKGDSDGPATAEAPNRCLDDGIPEASWAGTESLINPRRSEVLAGLPGGRPQGEEPPESILAEI